VVVVVVVVEAGVVVTKKYLSSFEGSAGADRSRFGTKLGPRPNELKSKLLKSGRTKSSSDCALMAATIRDKSFIFV
jgi:hypothetical protein